MPPKNAGKPMSRAHRRPPSPSQRAALVDLPAGGTDLPIPAMPGGREWSELERLRWDELWQSPQASQWDETARGTVALLVAFEAALLDDRGSAWQAQEARHASTSLGLTPASLAALGWRIV